MHDTFGGGALANVALIAKLKSPSLQASYPLLCVAVCRQLVQPTYENCELLYLPNYMRILKCHGGVLLCDKLKTNS